MSNTCKCSTHQSIPRQVDSVLDRRVVDDRVEYLVKWKDALDGYCSWVCACDIQDQLKDYVTTVRDSAWHKQESNSHNLSTELLQMWDDIQRETDDIMELQAFFADTDPGLVQMLKAELEKPMAVSKPSSGTAGATGVTTVTQQHELATQAQLQLQLQQQQQQLVMLQQMLLHQRHQEQRQKQQQQQLLQRDAQQSDQQQPSENDDEEDANDQRSQQHAAEERAGTRSETHSPHSVSFRIPSVPPVAKTQTASSVSRKSHPPGPVSSASRLKQPMKVPRIAAGSASQPQQRIAKAESGKPLPATAKLKSRADPTATETQSVGNEQPVRAVSHDETPVRGYSGGDGDHEPTQSTPAIPPSQQQPQQLQQSTARTVLSQAPSRENTQPQSAPVLMQTPKSHVDWQQQLLDESHHSSDVQTLLAPYRAAYHKTVLQLKDQQAKTIAALMEKHAQDLAEVQQTCQNEKTQLQQQLAQGLAELRTNHQQEIDSYLERIRVLQAEVAEVRTDAQEQVTILREQLQVDLLNASETNLRRLQLFEQQLEEARANKLRDEEAAQQRFKATLDAQAAKHVETVTELAAQVTKQRTELLDVEAKLRQQQRRNDELQRIVDAQKQQATAKMLREAVASSIDMKPSTAQVTAEARPPPARLIPAPAAASRALATDGSVAPVAAPLLVKSVTIAPKPELPIPAMQQTQTTQQMQSTQDAETETSVILQYLGLDSGQEEPAQSQAQRAQSPVPMSAQQQQQKLRDQLRQLQQEVQQLQAEQVDANSEPVVYQVPNENQLGAYELDSSVIPSSARKPAFIAPDVSLLPPLSDAGTKMPLPPRRVKQSAADSDLPLTAHQDANWQQTLRTSARSAPGGTSRGNSRSRSHSPVATSEADAAGWSTLHEAGLEPQVVGEDTVRVLGPTSVPLFIGGDGSLQKKQRVPGSRTSPAKQQQQQQYSVRSSQPLPRRSEVEVVSQKYTDLLAQYLRQST